MDSLTISAAKGMLAEQELIPALKKIVAFYGKVCDNFELCHCKSCQSSYGSWEEADRALKNYEAALEEIKRLDLEKRKRDSERA
ncbi:Uncharacterised protein [uncultured archaeon]|nr:Uncharacterised protein [uncultured archaeon]